MMGKTVSNQNSRISKLRKTMLSMPQICIERGYYMTESYKQTEADPPVIRRAKGLANVLNNITIGIDPDELIVGRSTSKPRGGMLMPEVQWKWYLDELEIFSTREWDKCAPISKEDKAKMKEFLPYWKGKSMYDKWLAAMPADALKYNDAGIYITNTGCVSGVHLAHPAVDFEAILQKGLKGIKQDVDGQLAKLDLTNIKDFEKFHFLTALNIILESAMNFAKRYATLAKYIAAKEKNANRKAELEKIAKNCEWVPTNPPRNFYEAVQAIWLAYIVLRIEAFGPGIGLGRPDQFFYPFYKKDIAEGILTKDGALELIAMLLIKVNDAVVLMSSVFAEQLAGFPTITNVTLGGVTNEGRDAVNELSYLFLEAEKQVGLTVEEIVVRVNKLNPDAFLMKAAEVNKALTGKFKFLSDDTAIQQMMVDGKVNPRDYVVVGCFTPSVTKYSYSTSACMVNTPFMLELALNNGVSRLTGKQLGPKTGDPKKFKTYEQVWEAFKKQVDAAVPQGVLARYIDRKILAEWGQVPFQSALHYGCIEKGIDVMAGGMVPYATEGHGLLGGPNVGDSLAAIKKVVFEDKNITMAQLITALDKNFEGEEKILHLLNKAPKFGNDIDYVDSLVNDALMYVSNTLSKYRGIAGTKQVAAASAGTGHLGFGQAVGALPDGRKAGEPLSEGGISPHQGRNVSGATATLRSVAKLDHLKLTGGSVLNMKLNPSEVKDESKMRKFISMLRTYCETGGYLVQFNIVSGDMLRDAQKHPEKYRDLLVRVATYSAYFVELSPTLQNDIIARTEFHEL
jgi:pyruvate formate-lyase/glycerol dehydratase family glycyl radical enzyme